MYNRPHTHYHWHLLLREHAISSLSSNPQLSRVLLDATTVVFGDNEVSSSSERIAIESPKCKTGHIHITTGICCYGAANEYLVQQPPVVGCIA
jgi:hypothetical protein